jgi:hypothetical protein
MGALLVCWIAFPALLGLIAHGCGALVERLAGLRMTLGVRIPCGVALMIAVLDLATRSTTTAHLAVTAVVVLAVIGLVLSPPWRWRRPGPGLLAGGIVFAVYAAPVVVSGTATWTGYIKLDDTATFLALVDRALSHGHSLLGLPPSTYRATLGAYLVTGYPIASFLPIGLGHVLLGEDGAWLVNPWMAFLAATLALALHEIARLALGERARPWRAVAVAALAAQPALLYAYYLWGGIKEMAAATLIAAFAVTAPLVWRGGLRLRSMIPAAVVLCALWAAESPGGFVYAGPGFVLALLAWGVAWLVRRTRPQRASSEGGAGADSSDASGAAATQPALRVQPGGAALRPGLRLGPRWMVWLVPLAAAALGAYLVLAPGGFVEHFKTGLTGEGILGNLVKPLSVQQLAGIWPVGDFRFPPDAPAPTHVLVVLVVAFAALGLFLALRDGREEFVLYVLCALAGGLLVDLIGAPWVAGKALASTSPALPFAALTAVAWPTLATNGDPARAGPSQTRPAGEAARGAWQAIVVLGACAIAGGILWSNVLAYHDASLAPRAQFEELAEIGTRIAGQGPTLMTEYQPYGARHFLRDAAPEAASELRERDDPLLSGQLLEPGASADIDQIQLPAVLVYRTLVLQRNPLGSRPPSPYRLTFAGHFWEVWQRPQELPYKILWHLPLGDPTHPGALPDCATLEELAHESGVASLVAQPVENPLVVSLQTSVHPPQWFAGSGQLAPTAAGTAKLTATVTRTGRYSVWIGGSTRGPLTVYVNDTRMGQVVNATQESGQYLPFGEIFLTRGTHTVELRYGGGLWRPGVGGPAESIGPLVLRRETGPADSPALSRAPLVAVTAKDASALCRRTLDWVEGIN